VSRVVLVADDSPTIQKRVLGILTVEGFEVETVSNGVAAVKRLAFIRPVVILADVSMPGRDGYEVCDFVKNSAVHGHVPVLLIASDMEPYDESRGTQVRADGKITKPFDAQELVYMVERFAAQYEASAVMGSTQLMTTPGVGLPAPPEFHLPEEAVAASAIMRPYASDFSTAAEGVAFADPAAETEESLAEQSPEFDLPMGSATSRMEFSPPGESTREFAGLDPEAPALAHYDSVAFEEPAGLPSDDHSASFQEPPVPAPVAEVPLTLDAPRAAAPEPVFIEEEVAPPVEPSYPPPETRTMIFRTPLDLADPVWRDETGVAAPPPEPVAAVATDPQIEYPAAPAENTSEQPAAPEPVASPEAATSLESFALDDATAGQVRFASQAAEAPSREAAPMEVAPGDDAPPEVSARPAAEVAQPMEPPTESPADPAAEVAEVEDPTETPASALQPDSTLVSEIVHRVVTRMAPPALPKAAIEEMEQRLTEEIAFELSRQPPPPSA
jgi:CheY-like chemotaxis protein